MTIIKLLDDGAPVKLEWLRTFLAVADAGGFTRAARGLRMSQPAVSVHVKELERNLGVRLFERIGGRVQLSRPGQAAAAEARSVLDGVRTLRTAVAESEGEVGGILALGASTTPGNYLLPPIMGRFERRHPGARTTLRVESSGRILARLQANEVDLAVIGLAPPGEEFVSTPWREDEVVVFAGTGHPLARKRKLTAADLAGQRFLVRESESATRRLGDAWFAQRRIHVSVMELGSPETVKRMAAAGLGLGILSRFAIAREAGERELLPLRVAGFPIRRGLHVVRLRRKQVTRAMAGFLDLMA